MTIEAKEVFVTLGQEFPTFQKALEWREGRIEEFLRKAPGFHEIPAKLRIPFVQHVLDNREALRALLDYSDKQPATDD